MKRPKAKPQRGFILVASHSYGWLNGGNIKHAFRYATRAAEVIAYLRHAFPDGFPTSHMNGWLPMSDAYGIAYQPGWLPLSDAYGIECEEFPDFE